MRSIDGILHFYPPPPPPCVLPRLKIAGKLFLYVFFVSLFIPGIFLNNRSELKLPDNRLAAFSPRLKITETKKINENYTRDWDAYLNDRFGWRSVLIELSRLLKKSHVAIQNGLTLYGKNGWEFYAGENSIQNYQNIHLFSDDELKRAADYLSTLDNWCNTHGKRFYLFIAPDKNKIYGEFYPSVIKKINPDSKSRANQLVNFLRANTSIKVVYPYDVLHEHKKDGLLYWAENNTHWNELGAYYGYADLMKTMQIEPIGFTRLRRSRKPILKDGNIYLVPDIPNMADYDDIYSNQLYKLCKFQSLPPPDGYKNITENRACHNENGKYNVFMFRDSFGQSLTPYLANTFKDMTLVWRQNVTTQDLEYIKDNNVDIVIDEIVERYITAYSHLEFPKE
ncbi:MAG: hypothetical protein LBU43_10720 [Candidatus Accumulibacter sp.]|nr:hypothetical protein [Accumulibacter sp.]